MASPTEPRFLIIGRVARPHGVHGEVSVEPFTDLPERFTWLKTVYVGEINPRPAPVENARFHQGRILLKLAGYDDREAAESLRFQWLQVPEAEAIPLAEDEFYLYQAIGLVVYNEDGDHLGEVVEILETPANYVFVVNTPAGELLLPHIPEVVREIDFERGRMTVRLLPGL
ncbi:MAG: ribosome maturation factor RimM [Chloroflexota bacterium]